MGKKAVFRLFYCISIVLTFALAGITLAGAFAANTLPDKHFIIPLLGLALPILLLLNVATTIYWGIRWRFWIIVPLIAILGNWGYLSRVFRFSFSSEKPQQETLKVATYNVDSFGNEQTGFSCKEIASFMKEQKVDIICFQEFGHNQYFTRDSIKQVLANWGYQIIPQSPDSLPILQIALFSKYPVTDSRLITYPNSKNCSMWCDIDVNGQLIRVFNNHLQTTEVSQNKRKLEKEIQQESAPGQEKALLRMLNGLQENFTKRAAQAETLQKLINTTPHPVLVCGDFNSLPSSYTYHTVKGSKLNDGFQTCGHGYMYTFRYFKRLLRIDYILHSNDLKGIDYYSPPLDYSDHNPVIMEVEL